MEKPIACDLSNNKIDDLSNKMIDDLSNITTCDLSNKTAVITGAGGVLCSVFAEALACCNANVALIGRSLPSLKLVENKINSLGKTAKSYSCDVLDKNALTETAKKIYNDFGKIDILINGAGGNNPKATTDKEYYEKNDNEQSEQSLKDFFCLNYDDVMSVFELNFMGAFVASQIFAKYMIKNGGNILNISSMNAFNPLTKIPAYSAAKAALSNFTKWLSVYFSKSNIRVNAIAPGFFSSKQNKSLLWNVDGSPTERTKKILAATPAKRFGEPSELIGALLFLVNDKASSFVNGIVLPVDGGFSAYSGV